MKLYHGALVYFALAFFPLAHSSAVAQTPGLTDTDAASAAAKHPSMREVAPHAPTAHTPVQTADFPPNTVSRGNRRVTNRSATSRTRGFRRRQFRLNNPIAADLSAPVPVNSNT